MRHLPDVPHRLDVRVHEPVPEWRVVDVGVEVDHVDRPVPGPDHGRADRMITADDDRQRTGRKDRPQRGRDVFPGALGVCRKDVHVARVRDQAICQLVLKERSIGASVVVAIDVEPKRVFADPARAEPGAGQVG